MHSSCHRHITDIKVHAYSVTVMLTYSFSYVRPPHLPSYPAHLSQRNDDLLSRHTLLQDIECRLNMLKSFPHDLRIRCSNISTLL